MNIGGVAQWRAAPPSRPGRSRTVSSGDERRVVVLGPDRHHVLEPTAVVRVGAALARVLEAPCVPLVGPVRRVPSVRLAPVADRGPRGRRRARGADRARSAPRPALRRRSGRRPGRRPRPARARRGCPRRAPPSRAPSRRSARARFGSSAPRRGPARRRREGWTDRGCGTTGSRGWDQGAPAPRPARSCPTRRSRPRWARSPCRTARRPRGRGRRAPGAPGQRARCTASAPPGRRRARR